MNKYELSTHPDVGSLADRQASLHLNDQDFCRRVGFSLAASSWGKIKAGTWSGNCDNALVAVQQALASGDDQPAAPVVDGDTVLLPHISLAVDAVEAASCTKDEHRLVFIVGKTGSGKSKTAAYLASRFNGAIINAAPAWEKSYLHALASIGAGLGIGNSWRSAGDAERSIIQALQTAPRLIIIDEANHFNRATLNFLKTVLNLTRCGLVLLTLPDHMARMSADSREEFPQLLRRSIAIIHIPSITGEEVSAIQRGLFPQMDIRNTSPICALANQFYNLDTVRRVLEEIDAGQTPDAAVKAVRLQPNPSASMTAPATIETETAAQFISMALSTYGVPFQVLSPTPYPDKIGIRLHPEEQYCIVHAEAFLAWMSTTRPSLDKLRATLDKKIKLNRRHV